MTDTEEKHINIISFDIPYPADYGGVIDIFYKIKALSEIGVKIHLHCFEYGREQSDKLNKLCESANYYKRDLSFFKLLSLTPFIVNSRSSSQLIKNLSANNYPILFEGIHTTYYLGHNSLKGRKQFVRTHNIEHEYYSELSQSEKRLGKKLYLLIESFKLKWWEKKLAKANILLTISENDNKHFTKFSSAIYLPAFHSNNKLNVKEGKGDYILYHGNLSVQENIKAVLYLIDNVFNSLSYRVVIAGKNPDKQIMSSIENYSNIELIANPSEKEMQELVRNAHINVLITFQATGIKLKLINSLFNGRFCLVNSAMVDNTGLAKACEVVDDPDEMQKAINQLFEKEFSTDDKKKRVSVLLGLFSNSNNVRILEEVIP